MAIRTIVITDDDGELDVATTECTTLEALGLLKLAEYSILEQIVTPDGVFIESKFDASLN